MYLFYKFCKTFIALTLIIICNCDLQELTADLIQLKQPVKVTEIRVIPLGATVDLSTGAFQLG